MESDNGTGGIMARVLITGATGLVGGELLRLLLADRRVTAITAPAAGRCRRMTN